MKCAFDKAVATTLIQAICHQTQCEISSALHHCLWQESSRSTGGQFKTQMGLSHQLFLLGTNPCLALKLHQILQPPEAMNYAMFKNNGELIAIPAGAEYHFRLELKIQQLVRTGLIKVTAIFKLLHLFAIQQGLQRTPRVRQIALQLRQRCIRQLQSDGMGTVNLHRRQAKQLIRNDDTTNGL